MRSAMSTPIPTETLRQSVKPVVSAVNGLCQGGGLQIALCSDMAVVSDRATFRVPELFRGIADTYYSQILARLIGPVRTRDLMLTGRTLTAAEAEDWGMVSRVVPHDELLPTAMGLAEEIAANPPLAVQRIKEGLALALDPDWDEVGRWVSSALAELFLTEDHREGVAAFLEKREPTYVGR